jgi:hypothetical protein
MGSYIDDAGGGERQSDSFLGNPDTIFHGENDPFTQQLDARMIAKLTPEERLKMGAEIPEKLEARVEAAAARAAEDLIAKRRAPEPPRSFWCWNPTGIAILLLLAFALLIMAAIRGRPLWAPWENPRGNSPEIPVKPPIPTPSPAPTTP